MYVCLCVCVCVPAKLAEPVASQLCENDRQSAWRDALSHIKNVPEPQQDAISVRLKATRCRQFPARCVNRIFHSHPLPFPSAWKTDPRGYEVKKAFR